MGKSRTRTRTRTRTIGLRLRYVEEESGDRSADALIRELPNCNSRNSSRAAVKYSFPPTFAARQHLASERSGDGSAATAGGGQIQSVRRICCNRGRVLSNG